MLDRNEMWESVFTLIVEHQFISIPISNREAGVSPQNLRNVLDPYKRCDAGDSQLNPECRTNLHFSRIDPSVISFKAEFFPDVIYTL